MLKGRSLTLGLVVLAVVIAVGASWMYVAAAPSAAGSLTVAMSGAIEVGGGATDLTITVNNGSTDAVSNVYVAGSIPTNTTLDSALTTPQSATYISGTVAAWTIPTIAAGGKQSFTYKVKVTTAPTGSAHAFVHWTSPSDGTALSGDASWQDAIDAGGPKRGCLACHVAPYTLAREAEDRAAVDFPGQVHPTVSPSGISLKSTDVTGPAPCLECHAPGTGSRTGMGNIAPISLRDIVHPAHMFSTTFVGHYNGNCFTCHNVRGDGTFELLGDKVSTNEKGVPRALEQGLGKITGEILPSEGK